MKTIIFICLLLGCLGCHKLFEQHKQHDYNVFHPFHYSSDTLNNREMEQLIKFGIYCEKDEHCYSWYKFIRFNDNDTSSNNFMVYDPGGSGGGEVTVIVNGRKPVILNDKDYTMFWGGLNGYYMDKDGNKTPIFTVQVDSKYIGIHRKTDYTGCNYIYLPTYIITRGRLTDASLEMDSILNVDGSPLDRYLYDSLAAVYFPNIQPSKSTQIIGVDNFRKIRIAEYGFSTECGVILDSSMCIFYDINTNISLYGIDSVRHNRYFQKREAAAAIVAIAEPTWELHRIARDKLFLHYFTHEKYGKCALVAYYDSGKERTIIASADEPYCIYNNINSYMYGYYTDIKGLPLLVIEHDIDGYCKKNNIKLSDDMGSGAAILYRWHKGELVADSILSVDWVPATPKQAVFWHKIILKNNVFEQIRK